MSVDVRVTWRNDNPATIWNRLAAKLGREPTAEEAKAEVRRILDDAAADHLPAGRRSRARW